ncbi:tetratricopeptide repeat protein [Oceanithermus sp.]
MYKRSWLWMLMVILSLGVAAAQAQDAKTATQEKKEPSVKAYLLVGDVYYSSGEYDAAMIAFRRALEKEPNNVYALYGLGRTQLRMLQFSAAIENLKKAIALDSNFAPAYVALAEAYTDRYTYAEDKKSAAAFLDQALLILDDALRIDPNYYPIYNQRGLIYQYKGDLKKAEEAYKKALELEPKDPIVHYNLAQVYLSEGRLDEALEMLRKGVELDPESAQLQLLYGKALTVKGDLAKAEGAFKKGTKLDPLNASAWLSLGQVYYLEKKYDEAAKALSNSIELDPLSYPEAYFYLGRTLLDQGKKDEARSNFTKAVKLAPKNADYHYWLARSLLELGKKDEARTELEKALNLNPKHEAAKKALAELK